MNFWRRKSAVPAAQAVQLRGREQHPFTGLRGFTPQRSGELRLYQAVREAVPVVDAAVCMSLLPPALSFLRPVSLAAVKEGARSRLP